MSRTEPIATSPRLVGTSMHPAEHAAVWRRTIVLPRLGIAITGTHGWLAGIFLIGLLLRLIWVYYTDTLPLGGDPSWYFGVARNLYEGKGYVADHLVYTDTPIQDTKTAFWPPAYPVLLASMWKITGFSLMSAKVLNATLGAMTIVAVYMLGTAMFHRKVGLCAAALFAVFPNAIAWTPLLFPEALFILTMVLTLWLLAQAPDSPRSSLLIAGVVGLLVGLAALTRGQGLVLVPVAVVFWLSRDGWRGAARQSLVMLIAAALLIAPWTIRNWVVLDSPVIISTNAGVSLRTGHAPDSTGTSMWTSDPVRDKSGDLFYAEQSAYDPEWEVVGYRVWTRRAIEYALTHPRREFDLTRYKVYHLYRSDSGVIPWLTTLGVTPIEPLWLQDRLWVVFDASYYSLLFAALAFMPLWLMRGGPNKQLLVNVLVFWTLFHVAFNGEPRYHVPLYPLFALSAVGGLATIAARWRQLGAEGLRRDGARSAHGHEHSHELTQDPAFLALNKDFYLREEDYDLVAVTDSHRIESLFHRGRTRMLRRLIARYGAAPYVDAGCGTGLLLRELPAGATGVDINPRNVPRAKRNAPHANVVTADIEALPMRPGSVRTVVLTEVLEHFPNPADVVRHLAALLPPGGRCIGSVPSQSLIWQLRFLSGSPAEEPFHKNYTKKELQSLFESEFSSVEVGVANWSMSVYFIATK